MFRFAIRKNLLWRAYDTQCVGLGLWGRCVSYVHKTAYHMHTKVHFYNCIIYMHFHEIGLIIIYDGRNELLFLVNIVS